MAMSHTNGSAGATCQPTTAPATTAPPTTVPTMAITGTVDFHPRGQLGFHGVIDGLDGTPTKPAGSACSVEDGYADLAPGAADALGDVVKGVAAGQTAVISGYHDTTGDPAQNEELAKQRALAVRDALKALGIGDDKLDLKKPEVTTATGSNAEARRVEVSLQ